MNLLNSPEFMHKKFPDLSISLMHAQLANTTNKLIFKSNITDLKDAFFAQGHLYDVSEYEDSIETLVNYV